MNRGNTSNILLRSLFSLAIFVYVVIWAVVFLFESSPFGIGSSILSSFILAVPFVIALRMLFRWNTLRVHEFVYLLALTIFVYGGVAYSIWDMFDKGQDRYYKEQLEFSEFDYLLHKDPAFHNVELLEAPKAFWMRGIVNSDVDLDRLKKLSSQGLIHWSTEYVKVINNSENVEGKREQSASHGKKIPLLERLPRGCYCWLV
jgi:hypothetical protein